MDEHELMSRLIDAGLSGDDLAQAARLIDSGTPAGDARRRLLADAALLRHAAACAEPTGGWHAYDARLREGALRITGNVGNNIAPLAPRPWRAAASPWRRAAVLALALGGWIVAAWFMPRPGSPDTGSTIASHTKSRPTHDAVRPVSLNGGSEAIQLFREVESMFGARTGWVVMHDGTADMGLRPQTVSNPSALVPPGAIRWAPGGNRGDGGEGDLSTPSPRPQAPSLTASSHTPVVLLELEAGLDGQMLSRAKVAIVPGATAQFSVPDGRTGQQLRFMLATSTERPYRVAVLASMATSTNVADTDATPFAVGVVLCATDSGPSSVADSQTVWVAEGCTLRLVAAAIGSPESQP